MENEYREALDDLLKKVTLEKTINSQWNIKVGKDKVKLIEACDRAKKYDELINSEITIIGGKGKWQSFEQIEKTKNPDSFEFHNEMMEYIEKLKIQWALDLIEVLKDRNFLNNMNRKDGSVKEYIIDKIKERYHIK